MENHERESEPKSIAYANQVKYFLTNLKSENVISNQDESRISSQHKEIDSMKVQTGSTP